MKNIKTVFAAGIFTIIMGMMVAIIQPLIAIAAINILFPQANIDYTFFNWCAIFALRVCFGGTTMSVSCKKEL